MSKEISHHDLTVILGTEKIKGPDGLPSPEAYVVLDKLNSLRSLTEKARFLDEMMNNITLAVLKRCGVTPKV